MYKVGHNWCKPWSKEESLKFKEKGIDFGQHVHFSEDGPGSDIKLYFGNECIKTYDVEDIEVPKFRSH